MNITKLKYSRGEVNRAGDFLRDNELSHPDAQRHLDVLSYWRAAHNYPINTFQATLRTKLKLIDNNGLVAQRLKRISSIVSKLQRFQSMQLSQIQDIGGLRAVVANLQHVYALYNNYKQTRFSHKLHNEKNYIITPKSDGYRGIHLIYQYYNSEAPVYNGLCLELQLRTKQQHAWATAVETMGTILNAALKSNQGSKEWLDFFSLAGAAIAHREGQNTVPGYEHLNKMQTYEAIIEKAHKMKVIENLRGFGSALVKIQDDKRLGTYYLLILDPTKQTIRYKAYSRARFDEATADYLMEEEKIDNQTQQQVVLVATKSVKLLARAYPNFFLDTNEFIKILERIEFQVRKQKQMVEIFKSRRPWKE